MMRLHYIALSTLALIPLVACSSPAPAAPPHAAVVERSLRGHRHGPLAFHFAPVSGRGTTVRVRHGDRKLAFGLVEMRRVGTGAPQGVAARRVRVRAGADDVRYPGIFDGVDLVLRPRAGTLEQFIVLNRLPALADGCAAGDVIELVEAVRFDRALDLVVDGTVVARPARFETFAPVELRRGRARHPVFHLHAPMAFDAAFAGGIDDPPVTFAVDVDARGAGHLTTRLPCDYLRAPHRTWPVYLDPAVSARAPVSAITDFDVAPIAAGADTVQLAVTFAGSALAARDYTLVWGDGETETGKATGPFTRVHRYATPDVQFPTLRACDLSRPPTCTAARAIVPTGGADCETRSGQCFTTTRSLATGACVVSPFLDDRACDDGDAFTINDACKLGKCTSDPVRPCRRDEFFVEVPIGDFPIDEADAAALEADLAPLPAAILDGLTALVSSPGGACAEDLPIDDAACRCFCAPGDAACVSDWFCAPGDPACPDAAAGVRVCVRPVLPDHCDASAFSLRCDVLRRLAFQRASFFAGLDEEGGTSLDVRPDALCDVVAALPVLAGGGIELRVGRECDGVVLAAEAAATDSMRRWHRERLGLGAASAAGLTGDGVTVTLIDSHLDPRVTAVLPRVTEVPVAGVTPSARLHRHGSAMALLLRQVAPAVEITSVPALDADGTATSATLARALDAALEAADLSKDALVVNLSVGWAPEYGRGAALPGRAGCRTSEAGVGEAARYVLAEARRRDAGGRPTLVVAAAGNRPLRGAARADTAPGFIPSGCEESVAGAPSLFFPAWWGRERSCLARGTAQTLVFPVGAVDAGDRPTAVSIPETGPPLVAPGQHVYVDPPDETLRAAAALGCAGAPPPEPVPLVYPATFTGTSVAAAITAGAAALVLADAAAKPPPPMQPLTGRAASLLLYLTGVDVCRCNGAVMVRRLAVDRVVAGLKCLREAPSLVARLDTCLGAEAATGLFDDTVLARCRAEVRAASPCLDAVDAAGRGCTVVTTCPATTGAATETPAAAHGPQPQWDDAYVSAPLCDVGLFSPPDHAHLIRALRPGECTGECPHERGLDRAALGALGPQPGETGCPDCTLTVRLSSTTPQVADLALELYSGFATGTKFEAPTLVVTTPTQKTITDLVPMTSLPAWLPGAAVSIRNLTAGAVMVPTSQCALATANLVMKIRSPSGTLTTDVSPLRVKCLPL